MRAELTGMPEAVLQCEHLRTDEEFSYCGEGMGPISKHSDWAG